MMQKPKSYKIIGIIMGAVIIVLSIFLIITMLQIKGLKPVRAGLQGYFQADVQIGEMSPGYRANFDYQQGKTYYISYIKDEEIISEGTYEKVNDVLYLLTDKLGKKLPITLVHDTFYYYDEKLDYMVEFKWVNSVPTYFKKESLSEEEKLMQQFLQTAYTQTLETPLETPEQSEEYWEKFYENLSGLCSEEGYEKFVRGAKIADRALDALQNKYERDIKGIKLDYDEKLQQANYTVSLEEFFEDGTMQTEEIKGIIGVQKDTDGSLKVHVFKEN